MMRAGVALAAFLASAGAFGQSLPATAPLPPTLGTASPLPGPGDAEQIPPYQPQIERLAERLGTLALLRELCGDGDAAEFRNRMAALLDGEGRSALRRDRLAGAFNRGFRGYAGSYRRCTPSARLVIARSLAEADRLARELAARYEGG